MQFNNNNHYFFFFLIFSKFPSQVNQTRLLDVWDGGLHEYLTHTHNNCNGEKNEHIRGIHKSHDFQRIANAYFFFHFLYSTHAQLS